MTAEQSTSKNSNEAVDPDDGWEATRWWRVIYADRRTFPEGHRLAGVTEIWCESSDEEENRREVSRCPGGGILQHLYERREFDWRES